MRIIALIGLPLTLAAGCTASNPAMLPDVVAYPGPAGTHAGIRPQHPPSVLGSYTRRAVVEPETWRSRNAPPSDWRSQNVRPAEATEPQS